MTPIPPPHPVRKRPMVAIPLAVAVAVACNPPAAADATGPDCSLDVEVTWDGGTVAWITATTTPAGDVAPRLTFQVLGEGNESLFYEQVTGQAEATVYPAVDGATAVYVAEGWRPGPLCERWAYPEPLEPEAESPAVEPPAYAPPAPEPGDHRDDVTPAPATEPATPGSIRTLHSL